LATKKTKIDSIFDKVHAMIYGEDGSILDVGSISSITTERFVLASATFAASAPGNGSVGCESHLPDVCEGDRVNEDYLDQLITHLRKRVVALNERIRDMTSAEQREAFGPYAPIIPIQIDVIDISLTGDAAVHTAIKLTQTGVEEVGKLVIPASGPAKWLLDKIGQLNPFKESYDLSDWDTICLDRNCGIIDPSNEYTPICEIASPAARHGKC
jgi:hypothetical protein